MQRIPAVIRTKNILHMFHQPLAQLSPLPTQFHFKRLRFETLPLLLPFLNALHDFLSKFLRQRIRTIPSFVRQLPDSQFELPAEELKEVV